MSPCATATHKRASEAAPRAFELTGLQQEPGWTCVRIHRLGRIHGAPCLPKLCPHVQRRHMHRTPIFPMLNRKSPGATKAQAARFDSLAVSTPGLKYASRDEPTDEIHTAGCKHDALLDAAPQLQQREHRLLVPPLQLSLSGAIESAKYCAVFTTQKASIRI